MAVEKKPVKIMETVLRENCRCCSVDRISWDIVRTQTT